MKRIRLFMLIKCFRKKRMKYSVNRNASNSEPSMSAFNNCSSHSLIDDSTVPRRYVKKSLTFTSELDDDDGNGDDDDGSLCSTTVSSFLDQSVSLTVIMK